jgi:branched-subunit amino acid aminotransferase/4-amino-4-deoxychorismate lyase
VHYLPEQSYMPLPVLVSRNGELIPPAEARISIFNPALSRSYGGYESFQVIHSIPFAETEHLERLAHSAAMIDLALPGDLPTFRSWIAGVLAANQAVECALRIFVLGPENGGETGAYIWPQPAPSYPAAFYSEGATAITFEGERSLPQAKTLNTLVSFLAQRRAKAAGVHEGLLYHDGHLTEGSNSNLFAVIDGTLFTPPAQQVLSGVARDMVFHVAERSGIPLREADLALTDLPRWQECFITSTSRHIMPVTVVDGRPVGDGHVGPHTRGVMGLFEDYFDQMIVEEATRQKRR